MSWLFKQGVRVRHALYDLGIKKVKHGPLPVVSIGNIVAGGAGKTQVALKLAEELQDSVKVAILSRGYKSQAEKKKGSMVVDVSHHRPAECGDEPWLLASRLPEVKVVVNKERLSGVREAQRLGAEVALLDDGMQHRRLHRDLEIVVIDSNDPFGGGNFLPVGRLREDPKRLEKADLIIAIGGKLSEKAAVKLARYTNAPRVEMEIEGSVERPLKGQKVGVFCGIGNPDRFLKTVAKLGVEVVKKLTLPDHQPIGDRELREFATVAKRAGATTLLCTEKDWVKLPSNVWCKLVLPVESVEAKLTIVSGEEAWSNMLERIKELA